MGEEWKVYISLVYDAALAQIQNLPPCLIKPLHVENLVHRGRE
jgi:hypothetical protein